MARLALPVVELGELAQQLAAGYILLAVCSGDSAAMQYAAMHEAYGRYAYVSSRYSAVVLSALAACDKATWPRKDA